jgi:hypothetical protein
MSKITLTELLKALQAQEEQRPMRQNRFAERALQAKYQDSKKDKKKFFKKNKLQAVVSLLRINFKTKEKV